jgi:murein DD-endopeptidase MepM/ murein hydrolase activator NlpD
MNAPEEISRGFGRRREPHRITIVHGDRVRAFHVDPTKLGAAVAAVGVFALAWIATTGYFFFRDDILRNAVSGRVQEARAYEDRVAALRAEIDRINARQLMDQEAFEAKLDRLLVRQSKLIADQGRIGGLVERAGDVGITLPKAASDALTVVRPAATGEVLTPVPSARTAPLVEPTMTGTVPPPPLDVERFATPLRSSRLDGTGSGRIADPGLRIASVEQTLVGFETGQRRALAALADLAEQKTKRVTRALGQIGFRLADPAPTKGGGGVGGPFVPAPDADPLLRVDAALDRLGLLKRAAAALPLARPLTGDLSITSGFGSRVDPFLGVPALHTGIDYRAGEGEPVRVTGAGTVIGAGRQGGYGLCVDVDHGNGVVTRYAHMSRIGTTIGAKLKVGDTVGSAGSTGRSTASHLHYETRVAGEPVDPSGFLDAGRELGL